MPKNVDFVDLCVHKDTRDRIRKAKTNKSYDEFINEILNFRVGY